MCGFRKKSCDGEGAMRGASMIDCLMGLCSRKCSGFGFGLVNVFSQRHREQEGVALRSSLHMCISS